MSQGSRCCHGPYPDEFVRKIMSAKSSKPMTANEFMRWLADNRAGRSH